MEKLHKLRVALFPPASPRSRLFEPLFDLLRDAAYAPFDSRLGHLLPQGVRLSLRRSWYRRRLASLTTAQDELRDILEREGRKPVILFLPGLDWEAQLTQRPQLLGRALGRAGALVFYLVPQPPPGASLFQLAAPGLYLASVPVETFRLLERPWAYTLTWNRKHLLRLEEPRIFYDHVDDLSIITGDPGRMLRYHRRLLAEAELVTVTSHDLLEQVQPARPDALYLPNGVDCDHFAPANNREGFSPPVELAPLVADGASIIGYYGALARWLDYNLLLETARLRPAYHFVLIGPALDASLAESGVLRQPNVTWLRRKTYEELPGYLRWFDVATIPFQLTPLTHAVSPVKLFEYMAGGKPVVATPMRETLLYPGVLAAEGAFQFAARLDEALALRQDPVYPTQLEATARQNTWDMRAAALLAVL